MSEVPSTPAWESVAILLAIAALWPKIFAPQSLVSDLLLYAALVLMIVVLVRKLLRFQKLWNPPSKD